MRVTLPPVACTDGAGVDARLELELLEDVLSQLAIVFPAWNDSFHAAARIPLRARIDSRAFRSATSRGSPLSVVPIRLVT